MNIPVFHDDQHGTAIISTAALINGLELVGKKIGDVKIAVSGAGAAAIACLDLMVELGVSRANVTVCDSKGVIYDRREDKLDESKKRYQKVTAMRTLADAMDGADVFSAAPRPARSRPTWSSPWPRSPSSWRSPTPSRRSGPELAKSVRPDCIIATGRSDYPNQVNNVLCFPYIFRGALDVRRDAITEAMKLACVRAIADLAEGRDQGEVARPIRATSCASAPTT
jgi:malate dehydrogenase (oxaloacetate-decarboxylating)(NADP+)